MIRVLAIDDEPLALQQLVAYIKKIDFMELKAACQSAVEARAFMDHDPVDAIFCDINMPDLSGMDFVKSLPVRPLIVFTTAYSEFAVEGYKVDAVDYLLKPFGFQDFQRAALKVQKALAANSSNLSPLSSLHSPLNPPSSQNTDDTIFVKTDYRMVRLSISAIRYVEAMSEYLRIYLDGQSKPVITLLSMKKMEEFLPSTFMRIHRSYIVNLDRVQEVGKNRVILDADTSLPIGESYKGVLDDYLSERYLGK